MGSRVCIVVVIRCRLSFGQGSESTDLAWKAFRGFGGYTDELLPAICYEQSAKLVGRQVDGIRFFSGPIGSSGVEIALDQDEVESCCLSKDVVPIILHLNFLGTERYEDFCVSFQLAEGDGQVHSRTSQVSSQGHGPSPWAIHLWVWGMRHRRRDEQRGCPWPDGLRVAAPHLPPEGWWLHHYGRSAAQVIQAWEMEWNALE